MIGTVEIKEDLCSFCMKKRSMKINFRENATVEKIDGSHSRYFVHMLKSDCSKVLQNFEIFTMPMYHYFEHVRKKIT